MVFSSPKFLCFLIFVLLVLRVLSETKTKKHFLAFASCFFYAAWDWRYLGLLLFTSVVDYYCAAKVYSAGNKEKQRFWLLVSLVSNFGLLGYFKYYNFFIENANGVLHFFNIQVPYANIILPAGISFYIFKTLSYVIDVYRGELQPCKSWLDYTTFITFFPELIAGPIVRGSVLIPQLESRTINPNFRSVFEGINIFCLGLTKKLLIADRIAIAVDQIFASPEVYSSASIWCGVIGYTIQIYCDFSGYSDMAIGCARMIGYDLPENFKMPYKSTNITEFWRRWHITLSTWLRDYLYIPLGGNRKGTANTYRNLFITMLLGGLWHGASWNFVIWGGLHGFALALHKLWTGKCKGKFNLPPFVGWFMTILFVVVTWVPFRAPTLESTCIILKKMFVFSNEIGAQFYPQSLAWILVLMVLGHIIGHQVEQATKKDFSKGFGNLLNKLGLKIDDNVFSGPYIILHKPSEAMVFIAVVWLACIFLFSPMNTNPFIYFQF